MIASRQRHALVMILPRTAAVASGGTVEVEVSYAGEETLSPRPLTPEEHSLIGLICALAAQVAMNEGASSVLTVEITLLLYLLVREFTRRRLPPAE